MTEYLETHALSYIQVLEVNKVSDDIVAHWS